MPRESGLRAGLSVTILCLLLTVVSRAAKETATNHGVKQTAALETAGRGTIFAFLTDGHLIAVDSHSGELLVKHKFAPVGSPGHYLALSTDSKNVFLLARGEPDVVAVLDAATAKLVRKYTFAGKVFRSLAVGPVTGRIYLFGNRDQVVGLDASVVVTVLDPLTGNEVANWTAKERNGYDLRLTQELIGYMPSARVDTRAGSVRLILRQGARPLSVNRARCCR